MKASKALTVRVSVFRGRISWSFSLSKNNISPAAPDLELILFPLWYWPIMNAHTKQHTDKVFETDFIDSQKSDPPFAHLLALSHIDNLTTPTNYFTVILVSVFCFALFVSCFVFLLFKSPTNRYTRCIDTTLPLAHAYSHSLNIIVCVVCVRARARAWMSVYVCV